MTKDEILDAIRDFGSEYDQNEIDELDEIIDAAELRQGFIQLAMKQ